MASKANAPHEGLFFKVFMDKDYKKHFLQQHLSKDLHHHADLDSIYSERVSYRTKQALSALDDCQGGGERGVRISDGQRIGICLQCRHRQVALALYHDPDILIFDEANSVLDNLTEKAVRMQWITWLGRKLLS